MATYSLDEVMAPEGKKTYSLDEIAPKKKATVPDLIDAAANFAYRASPLGILQSANDLNTKIVDKERNYLGDKTLELTGSPALATGAYMLPEITSLAVGNRMAAITPKPAPANELGRAADRLGYKPTLPQVTGNRDLANLYDTLSNMPGSAGVIARREAANQAAINSGVSKAIGQKSDRVTADVLADATASLGSTRNKLRADVNIPKGEQTILSTIDKASQELSKSLRSGGQFKGDMERIKQGINSGNLTGEQYQIWRTDLNDAKDAAYRAGKSKLGDAYKAVVRSLDDAARQNSGDAWKANDRQFSTLNMVQDGNIINPITGDVSAPLLTNKFYREFGKNAKQGKLTGEINDIATVTKGYPMLKEGSQTARREAYSSIVPWLLSPANYALGKMLVSSPYGIARNLMYGPAAVNAGGLLTDQIRQKQ
jgi:hypothetical protein